LTRGLEVVTLEVHVHPKRRKEEGIARVITGGTRCPQTGVEKKKEKRSMHQLKREPKKKRVVLKTC